MVAKIVLILTILLSLVVTVDSEKQFHLFSYKDRLGHLISYGRPDNDRNCYNIEDRFAKKARSIRNEGFCVTLYSLGDCKGEQVRFQPYCSGPDCCYERDFDHCKFRNKASSFKFC
uniref:SVWC domain-containing protein n=1 Tax=Panagrellus redivivus TaxID=6233 RepID=A0A7E4URX4_PANRE